MTRTDRNETTGRRALILAAVAVVAGAGFGRLAAAVARRDTAPADEAVHEATAVPEESTVRQAAATIAPAGKKKMYVPAALGASLYVLAAPGALRPGALRTRAAGVAAMLLTALAARGMNPAFDRWLPQPPPPPGHPPDRPVFPSGHAFGPGALSLATAYVMAREGFAATDLQAGLQELGITRDAVLVAHSQAGEVATYLAHTNPAVLSGAVLVDANVPQFFTDQQTQRLITLTTSQIEALKKAPSTKANRQLIATAQDFGPTHHAYHEISWPDSVRVTYIVSD